MAIIQSILVGKGKGKIGNVVLSGLKGQTVAKQLNSSPSNPRTVAQTANRVKMANAVLAWQYLANFMSNAKAIRKPLESTYNAFVRTVVNDMGTIIASSRALAAKFALNLENFAGNWFPISIISADDYSMQVSISKGSAVWSPTIRICGIFLELTTGQQTIVERPVTESEFNSGVLLLEASEGVLDANSAVYIYDSASLKMTNIAYLSA